jgi:hypothetical protein
VTRGRVSWKIISGTDKYATLRGNGTYTGEIIGGDPSDPISVIYRTTWTGMVEFDATPPLVGVAATATRLKQPAGAYSVRIRSWYGTRSLVPALLTESSFAPAVSSYRAGRSAER